RRSGRAPTAAACSAGSSAASRPRTPPCCAACCAPRAERSRASVDLASAPVVPLLLPHTAIVAAAVLLAVVTIALAAPVPVVLARASWPSRAPVLALLLWQVIGLAGGLSMIGALALAGYSLVPSWLVLLPAAGLAAYLLAHLAVTV